MRRIAFLLLRGRLRRSKFISDILISSHFRIQNDLVIEVLDDFAGSFVVGKLDFDLRFFQLHVAVFYLIRWQQLEEGIGDLKRYIPLHVGTAEDHGG